MRTSTRSIPIWAIPSVVLTIGTALCATLAAATLDIFVRRPEQGGGSITTLLPGLVYASATVMKVCLVSGLMSAVAGLAWRLFGRRPTRRASQGLPVWGITSIALTPLTPLLGALTVLGAQRLLAAPGLVSASHFPPIARNGVFVMLAILLAAVAVGVISLIRREQPRTLPILGLVVNMLLVGLFCHLRFYALGFDQDTWAPR